VSNPTGSELCALLVNVLCQEIVRITKIEDPKERLMACTSLYSFTYFATFQGIASMNKAMEMGNVDPVRAAEVLREFQIVCEGDWKTYFEAAAASPMSLISSKPNANSLPAINVPTNLNKALN
jgi:hypothetical protein